MVWILHTTIAIHLRDRSLSVLDRIETIRPDPALSIVTIIELEGGIAQDAKNALLRRERLDDMIAVMSILPFGHREARIYGEIIAKLGFLRSRVLDRMIAAQAIAHDATLITMNGAAFRNIAQLKFKVWPAA